MDDGVVVGDVLQDAVEVDLLLEERAEERGALHAGDGEHRDMVELGVVEPVDQVEPTRPRGRQTHTEPAGGLGVAARHEGGGLFVLDEHEADAVLVPTQPFHDPVDAVPRQPEHGIHAPVDEPLDEQFGRDLLHVASSLTVGSAACSCLRPGSTSRSEGCQTG
jgi:hypothetical protein